MPIHPKSRSENAPRVLSSARDHLLQHVAAPPPDPHDQDLSEKQAK
jgi:hypothetical protein